jgi:hypothetical protein
LISTAISLSPLSRSRRGTAGQRLFAVGLSGGNFRKIGREIVCRKILNTHFYQTDKRAAEIGFCFAAAIDNYIDSGDNTAMGANDIDCFLDAPTAGADLFATPLAAKVLFSSGGFAVPLTPGKYVLIDANLNKTAISFIKTSESKLTLSCPSAPSSPSAVLQEGAGPFVDCAT